MPGGRLKRQAEPPAAHLAFVLRRHMHDAALQLEALDGDLGLFHLLAPFGIDLGRPRLLAGLYDQLEADLNVRVGT